MPGCLRARPAALLLSILLCAPSQCFPADSASNAPSVAPPGEVLHYRVEWRLVHAGNVTLSWDVTASTGEGSWQTEVLLQSAGMVSKLYRIEDAYTSQLDDRLCTTGSVLTAQEGRNHHEIKVTYDSERGKAGYRERDLEKNTLVKSGEIDIPGCVHDVVGGLYRLRTMRVNTGQTIRMPLSSGKKSASARVEAQQREQVQTPAGVFQTIRYEAFLFNDVIYEPRGSAHVWLTDDDRRLPVQIRLRLELPIGTITLQLEKVEHT